MEPIVRCSNCRVKIGRQSEESLLLRTAYFKVWVNFFCQNCNAENQWISETERLRRETELAKTAADKLAAELAAVKAELEAEKKKPKK